MKRSNLDESKMICKQHLNYLNEMKAIKKLKTTFSALQHRQQFPVFHL